MTEAQLESMLSRGVQAAGGLALKLATTQIGAPDRLILHRGRLTLVELKTETGRLRPAQLAWHRAAARAGVEVVVLFGRHQLQSFLEGLHDAQTITARDG